MMYTIDEDGGASAVRVGVVGGALTLSQDSNDYVDADVIVMSRGQAEELFRLLTSWLDT